ncbi:MAG: DUF6174 domain-containing protein [Gemmatimonadaceae bacterium]
MRRSAFARRTSALLLALDLLGCSSATGLELDGEAARRRWTMSGPANYELTVVRGCECLPTMSGPVVVTVRGGAVTGRHYVTSGEPVGPAVAGLFPAVPGLFELIAEARRHKAARVDAAYDPGLGYPTHIAVDYDAVTVDDEVSYTVVSLTVH